MTSQEVAELTGKRHDNVIRDIDNLLKSLTSDLRTGFSMTYDGPPENGYLPKTHKLTGKRHDHVLRDIDNLLKSLSPDLGSGFSMGYYGPPENGYLQRLTTVDGYHWLLQAGDGCAGFSKKDFTGCGGGYGGFSKKGFTRGGGGCGGFSKKVFTAEGYPWILQASKGRAPGATPLGSIAEGVVDRHPLGSAKTWGSSGATPSAICQGLA